MGMPSPPTRRRVRRLCPLSSARTIGQDNRVLARVRQGVEHVIRRMKVFRVLKGVSRHRQRRFALRVQLIAALCNLTPPRPA
jgi:hypothetical protein